MSQLSRAHAVYERHDLCDDFSLEALAMQWTMDRVRRRPGGEEAGRA